ncbi:uncharacterized protein RB166_021291, partial [Leptodactylus fuscus]
SCPETLTTRLSPSQKDQATPSGRRRLKMVEAQKRRRAQARNSERQLTPQRARDRPDTAQRPPEDDTNTCPICGGHFPTAHLAAHAATCGEAPGSHSIVLSSSDDDWDDIGQPPAVSWVQCPLCSLHYRDNEIEGHASTCGE